MIAEDRCCEILSLLSEMRKVFIASDILYPYQYIQRYSPTHQDMKSVVINRQKGSRQPVGIVSHRDAGKLGLEHTRQAKPIPSDLVKIILSLLSWRYVSPSPNPRIKAGETPHASAGCAGTLSRSLLVGCGQMGTKRAGSGAGSCTSLYQVEHRIVSLGSKI